MNKLQYLIELENYILFYKHFNENLSPPADLPLI